MAWVILLTLAMMIMLCTIIGMYTMAVSHDYITDAFDNVLLIKTLRDISQGETVNIPVYDFKTHSR